MENQFNYTKRVLYFGMPDMGAVCMARLAQEGINIVGVVPPPPDAPTFRQFCDFTNFLKLNLIPYEKSLKDVDFLEKIKALNADIAIICSYSKKFPKELLNTMPNLFVNTHPSLLPNYRGGNPYSHVIINNEKKTGVTLHLMDETFDTGAMIVAREVDVLENETMGSLFNKLNYVSAELLLTFLQKFEQTGEIKAMKQPDGEFKKAPDINIEKNQNKIDWTKDAKYIERFVRALNPFIGATTIFRGMPIKIFATRVLDKQINAPKGVVLNAEKGLFVNAGNGIIEIRVLQVGSFFIGEGRDFIKHFNVKKGDVFNNG